ncbi:ty3-gypsy retrotransposon protein [Cucumis melo var. makuwa]|uniref:Ty3-gypsy retrotransposon protein n=2 Tax=Cucumis melo var. makuwa TaxID=1194695 RepID=A0A5D3CD55_CUCMM|nr:ty3-gypsy retrotransposon protein [Cucumis melo var. makuwa]
MTSQGNTSKALSDIGKRPNTHSRSREIQSFEVTPPFEVAKNIWEQISKPPKGGIVIKENPAIDEHYSSSQPSSEEMPHPNIMSVMVTNVDTSENRMTELEKKVNMLMKVVEERDYEIAFLKNHIESHDAAESSHKHTVKNTDKGKAVMQESQSQNSTSIESLSVQQLQEMIANSIKTQYGGPAQTFSLYSKPYMKRIDNLRMPNGYQPPKFQQFDGKGNPKQHVAHFIETCETADMLEQLLENQLIQLPECKRPEQAEKVDDPNYCKYHRVISHPVEKCFVLKELILKLAREKKIELDIDEVAQTNHVAIEMTSNVPPLTQLDDQRKSLIQFGTFAPILVLFQQRTVTINSQNKEAHGKDDGEGWITVTRQKGRQPNSIQKESRFHQKYAKGSISYKKKGSRNKKMWNPKPIKGKDEDFLQLRRSITLAEFLPRSFLEGHPEEILEVTACHAASIVEVDNNYGSSKEVNNSNEINQRTSVFDRIKPSTTRSSVFQRLSMATKEEENQCPTFIYTRTSTFKRLSISTSKKDRPSTSAFDRLKMTNDQQQREMKSSKAKPFREENDDDKIHSCVPSRMKRKLSVDINTEGSLTVKPRFIIFTNPTNEGDEQILVENKSC